MNVVDSSAWLSFFAGDANARVFSKPVEDIARLIVPSITLTEVFKCISRQKDEDMALEAIAHMKLGKVIDLDESLALSAAQYGIDHKLPLADSIIYATAKKYDATLWTQDSYFKTLENVKYFQKK